MRICGEILPGHSVSQRFFAQENFLCGVAVLVATYGHDKKTSTIAICVEQIAPERRIIAERTMGLAHIYDNSFVEVFFESEAQSKFREYIITIRSEDSSHNNAATLYITGGDQRIEGHIQCNAMAKRDDNDGIIARLAYAPPTVDTLVPPNLEISLVTQCNLNCTHCISRETRRTARRLDQDIRNKIKIWSESGQLKTAYGVRPWEWTALDLRIDPPRWASGGWKSWLGIEPTVSRSSGRSCRRISRARRSAASPCVTIFRAI